jgi:signal transduction histidine kinase/ligand-binding sensor protein
MNVKKYLRDVTPVNILDVFEESTLEDLLNGYSYALGSGITVMFATELPATMMNLKRKNALNDDYFRTFNPICMKWRKEEGGCNQEKFCQNADERVAMRYYKGIWDRPRLYRCEPLGLLDMGYPLRIDGGIVGVLFGGQILMQDVKINWRDELKDYGDLVDWKSHPEKDNQFQAVKKVIIDSTDESQRKIMLESLTENEPDIWKTVDVQGLKKRIDDFLRFGKNTQTLIAELHSARDAAAAHELLQICDQELTSIEFSKPSQWWSECRKTLKTLIDFPGIHQVNLYIRQRSQFICQLSIPGLEEEYVQLPAGEVISAFPVSILTLLSGQENGELLGKIKPNLDEVWGYREETGEGSEDCSTLMILQGNITDDQKDFMNDLCGVICTKGNLANLIFREREADRQYRLKVANTGHAFRTPLEVLELDLDFLSRAQGISDRPELIEKIKAGLKRIKDAKEDIIKLLEPPAEEQEIFDLMAVLDHVITSLEPLATKQGCKIVRFGTWPGSVLIQGDRYRVQRALVCLVDNAIKYSYGGYRAKTDNGGYQIRTSDLFEVRIEVLKDFDYVRMNIQNYGIGIPEEKLKAIRNYGVRAEVADQKRVRMGTGRGLAIAIEAFEELGGWITLTSRPAESATEEDKKEYHRYVTTVQAALSLRRK